MCVPTILLGDNVNLFRSAWMLKRVHALPACDADLCDTELLDTVASLSRCVMEYCDKTMFVESHRLNRLTARRFLNNLRRQYNGIQREAHRTNALFPFTRHTDKELSDQMPWCLRHLDMQETCYSCQMSYALTASMADAGLCVPPRPRPIAVLVSTMGQLYTVRVLPNATVRELKAVLAHLADWKLWQIDLYVGFRSLLDYEFVDDLPTLHISAIIRH